MISPEQFRFVKRATQQTARPDQTWSVFTIAITYLRMDTGEILASREQLAEEVGTLPRNVSTAMSDLVKIGAIVRHRRGRHVVYSINPHVGWAGGEGARQEAAKDAPKLRLVSEQLVLEDAIAAAPPR
ncbi:MAG: helix-turn-helix domain-containing protein [Rhodospirillaceae bacterium]